MGKYCRGAADLDRDSARGALSSKCGHFFIFQVGGWGEDEGWLRRRMDVSSFDGVFRLTVARLSDVRCICVQASCLDSDDGCSR